MKLAENIIVAASLATVCAMFAYVSYAIVKDQLKAYRKRHKRRKKAENNEENN